MKDVSKLSKEEREIILAKREYHRKWRAANKDKVKKSNQRYWQKVASKMENSSH